MESGLRFGMRFVEMSLTRPFTEFTLRNKWAQSLH